jgi:hypothetical protein
MTDKTHAHRFTLRTGSQVVSSSAPSESGHIHEVHGILCGPPISRGDDHTHKLFSHGIEVESGPSTTTVTARKDMDLYSKGFESFDSLDKGVMPDLVDPEHTYIFKTGEMGVYDYWYIDSSNNYWKYTNAPEDHEDYDKNLGIPIMDRSQPVPAENPQFFTFEGKKRHMAVPPDLISERNQNYNPVDSSNIWFEVYEREGERRYIYLDSDIRENIDLWVQYQLRITDANIPNLRKFAVAKFNKPHAKDKIVAAIIMLMDQGLYELEDLLNATVSDLEFIDDTVKLLGRKFVTDSPFMDFITSLRVGRDFSSPLFVIPSILGEGKVGTRYFVSLLKYLKVSPTYILSWNASYIYSKVVNRLSFEKIDPKQIDGIALSEVKRTFGTQKDLQYIIDTKLRNTLLENYKESITKSIVPRVDADEYGTLSVFSDLIGRRDEEITFSTWLHATPFHDLTPEEEVLVKEAVASSLEEAEQQEETPDVDAEGNPVESQVADQESGAVDTDFGKKEV